MGSNGSSTIENKAESPRGAATGHRRVRLTGQPSLSVVLISREDRSELEAKLPALAAECGAIGAELVVARAGDAAEAEMLRSSHETVRFVACPQGCSAMDLRSAGMAEAEGDIVTILDGIGRAGRAINGQLVHLGRLGAGVTQVQEDGAGAPKEADRRREPARKVDRLGPGDHVVIIGAGPGGLTPAYLLAKKGVRVTVLEADDVVGGISRTAQYKGYRFDIGGHRFFTKIKPVDDLWHEVLKDEFISVPRMSRIHYDGKFFDYPLKAANALGGLGIWRAITIVASYVYAHLRPSPVEDNLEQWVTNRFGRRLYEIFFKTYTEKVWGIPCTEIRAEWAAQRIQNLSLAKAILSAANVNRRSTDVKTLIHEFNYPRLGPGQMWEVCRDRLLDMGGQVLMRHRVTSLEVRDGRVVAVRADSPEGEVRIEGDHFISTMPIRNLIQSMEPSVPRAIQEAGAGLRYRDFLVVALILDRQDLFPDNWIYIHTPGVAVGRIQNFNNWSKAMVPDPGHTCLGMEYFCFEGDGLWSSPDEKLIELATRELNELGLAGGGKVVDGTVVRMPKAYPVYDSVYKQHLEVARSYLDPIPNLHLVGRNGMHKYNNQDHSMLTAMMTVWNLEGADYDVWAVNTDYEYHEEQRLEPARAGADRALVGAS